MQDGKRPQTVRLPTEYLGQCASALGGRHRGYRGHLRRIIRGGFEARSRNVLNALCVVDSAPDTPDTPDTPDMSDAGANRQSALRSLPSLTSSPARVKTAGLGGSRGLSAFKQHEELCLLSLRLPGRLAGVMDVLYGMPGIALADLAVLLDLDKCSAKRYVGDLNRLGLLCRRAPPSPPSPASGAPSASSLVDGTRTPQEPMRTVLSTRGVQLVALRHNLSQRSRPIRQALALARRVETESQTPQSLSHLRRAMSHDQGVYHFLALLTNAARGFGRLVWSETGRLAHQRYFYHQRWRNLRPDAVGLYRAGGISFRFWLEWDQGTMNLHDLTRKFASYAAYLDSGEWRHDHGVIPHLLIVAPDRGQLQLMRRAATQADLSSGAFHFACSITLGDWLEEQGPLSAIWWPLLPHGAHEGAPNQPATNELSSPNNRLNSLRHPRTVFPGPAVPVNER